MAYNVLSMDGGPSAPIWLDNLLALESWEPGFLAQADHVVGSSAGAMAAAYLAMYLPADPTTQQSTQCLQDCRAFVSDCFLALQPTSDDAYAQFLRGKTALCSAEPLRKVLDDTLGADTTLGDLPRPFSCQGGRMAAPWGPQVLSNVNEEHADTHLVSAILRSSAGPMCLPIHEIHVDGFVYTNNPSMAGLTRLIADGAATVDEVVLLGVGGDDGSSKLSNIFLPDNTLHFDGDMPLALKKLQDALDGGGRQAMADDYGALSSGIAHFAEHAEKMGLKLTYDVQDGANPDWGWLAWLAYLPNPVYLLQVVFSSSGRGVSQQAHELLGDRAFRLAPMGLMTSNVGFLLIALRLAQTVLDSGGRTAALWQNPVSNQALAFQPDIAATKRWLKRQWMVG